MIWGYHHFRKHPYRFSWAVVTWISFFFFKYTWIDWCALMMHLLHTPKCRSLFFCWRKTLPIFGKTCFFANKHLILNGTCPFVKFVQDGTWRGHEWKGSHNPKKLGDLQFTIVADYLLTAMILQVGPCEKHLSKSHHFGENRNVEFQGIGEKNVGCYQHTDSQWISWRLKNGFSAYKWIDCHLNPLLQPKLFMNTIRWPKKSNVIFLEKKKRWVRSLRRLICFRGIFRYLCEIFALGPQNHEKWRFYNPKM